MARYLDKNQLGAKERMHQKPYVNGSEQYSENIVETILTTTPSFVSSVAVTSMKIFFVFNVILLCSELMMGGMDNT